MTPEQIEAAARKLCELRGEDPDKVVMVIENKYAILLDSKVMVVNVPRWKIDANEIIDHDRIRQRRAVAKEMA